MKLIVKNYRALSSAEIDITSIALIAGRNGAGKTSTAQALASVLLGQAVILPDLKASEFPSMIRAGSDKAFISIEGPNGVASMKIPHGKLDTKGSTPIASRYALGLQCLVTDDPRSRAKVLMEYLKAIPIKEDLAAALPQLDGKYIDLLWKSINEHSWDGQHARVKDNGAKFKGQWEALSNENYGSQKAQSWAPEGWSGELATKSIDALQQEITDARSFLESAIATGAVSDEERERLKTEADQVSDLEGQVDRQKDEIGKADAEVAELSDRINSARAGLSADRERASASESAAKIPAIEKSVTAYKKAVDEAQKALDAARTKLAGLPKPGDVAQIAEPKAHSKICQCPHCKKDVCVDGLTLSIPVGPADKDAAAKAAKERAARTSAISTQEGVIRSKQDALATANKALGAAEADLANANAAQTRLAKLVAADADDRADEEQVETWDRDLTALKTTRDEMNRNLGKLEAQLESARDAAEKFAALPTAGVSETEINQRREAVRLAEQRLDVFKRKTQADALAEKIQLNTQILEALDPKGVRQKKLGESLGAFNTSLKKICETAHWPIVEVDEDLRTSVGGWRYSLASASMQWRIRATLQIAMAEIDRSDILAFDAADILDTPGRNGLLSALIAIGKPALITMTESKLDRVPNLDAKNLGHSYWIEGGNVQPLSAAIETRAAA